MSVLLNANRVGSTGKRIWLGSKAGRRQLFKFSNCAIVHWTRSIRIQRYSVTNSKKGVWLSAVSLCATDSLLTNVSLKRMSLIIWCNFLNFFVVVSIYSSAEDGDLDKRMSMSEDSVFTPDKGASSKEEVRNSFTLNTSNLAVRILHGCMIFVPLKYTPLPIPLVSPFVPLICPPPPHSSWYPHRVETSFIPPTLPVIPPFFKNLWRMWEYEPLSLS